MTDENGQPVDTPTEPTGTPNETVPPVETPPAPSGQETPPQEAPPPQEAQAPPTNAEADTPSERVVPAADGYTLPDGAPSDFGTFANSLDMTQQQADGVLKAHDALQKVERQVVRQAGEAHVKSWGERADYNMNLAKRAMKQYDSKGTLTKVLDDTGFGSHPAVLEFFFELGQGMQEGGFLKSELKAPGQKTPAQKMFPHMRSESM